MVEGWNIFISDNFGKQDLFGNILQWTTLLDLSILYQRIDSKPISSFCYLSHKEVTLQRNAYIAKSGFPVPPLNILPAEVIFIPGPLTVFYK